MSVKDRIAALYPPEREALDRIRRELGMERQKNPCPCCGDERWDYHARRAIEDCETCGGQRVRAANLMRAIIAHAQRGLGVGKPEPSGLGHWDRTQVAERVDDMGALDSTPPPRDFGRG